MSGLKRVSGLERFINKFVATIVEYHGHAQSHDMTAMEAATTNLLAMPTEELVNKLGEQIKSNAKSTDYEHRVSLLHYCLELFKMINGHIKKGELLDEQTCNTIKSELGLFLSTMQYLYKAGKVTKINVEFNNQSYELYGFMVTGSQYFTKTILGGSPFCQSGQIIEDNFFKAFQIPLALSEEVEEVEEEIKIKLDTLISEFQSPLIIAAQDNEILSLKAKVGELEQKVTRIEQLKEENQALAAQAIKDKARISELEQRKAPPVGLGFLSGHPYTGQFFKNVTTGSPQVVFASQNPGKGESAAP